MKKYQITVIEGIRAGTVVNYTEHEFDWAFLESTKKNLLAGKTVKLNDGHTKMKLIK